MPDAIHVTEQTKDEDLDNLARSLIRNHRFYFENLLWIRSKDKGLIRFRLNYEQLGLLKLMEDQGAAGEPIRGVVLKPRRIGASTLIQAMMFKKASTEAFRRGMTIAHDLDSANELFEMEHLFLEKLHEFWRPMTRYSNRKEIIFDNPDAENPRARPGLKSHLTIDSAEKKQVGRSKLIHLLHCSELAFWPYAKDTLLAVQQSVPRAEGTMIVKESTGNGVGGEFYKDYQDAKKGITSYFYCFFPWQAHKEYRLSLNIPAGEFEDSLDSEEEGLIKDIGASLEQLNWRRSMIAEECRGDPEKFRQEYPSNDIEAFIVSGRMVFNGRILQRWAQQTTKPQLVGDLRRRGSHVNVMENPRGYFKMWEPPKPGHSYVIGGDVAEGIDITEIDYDYSCADVVDREDLSLAGTLHGHITPDTFGDAIALLGKAYNTAYVGVEANNHGLVTLNRLRDLGYSRLFYRTDIEAPGTQRKVRKLGWLTTQRTKPSIIDDFVEHVNRGTCIVPDEDHISEMNTYVRKPDGKTNGQQGCHDDRVMAYAIALRMHKVCGLQSVYPSIARRSA